MADKKLGFFESFMLSGAAAGVSKTAAAPIERVKLLVQNQDEMIKQVKECCERILFEILAGLQSNPNWNIVNISICIYS